MAKSAVFACFIFVSCFTIISSASLRLRRSTDETQVPDAMLQLLQRYDVDDNIEPIEGLQNDENPLTTNDRFFWQYLLSRAAGKSDNRILSRTRKRCRSSWKILC